MPGREETTKQTQLRQSESASQQVLAEHTGHAATAESEHIAEIQEDVANEQQDHANANAAQQKEATEGHTASDKTNASSASENKSSKTDGLMTAPTNTFNILIQAFPFLKYFVAAYHKISNNLDKNVHPLIRWLPKVVLIGAFGGTFAATALVLTVIEGIKGAYKLFKKAKNILNNARENRKTGDENHRVNLEGGEIELKEITNNSKNPQALAEMSENSRMLESQYESSESQIRGEGQMSSSISPQNATDNDATTSGHCQQQPNTQVSTPAPAPESASSSENELRHRNQAWRDDEAHTEARNSTATEVVSSSSSLASLKMKTQ